MANMTKDGDMIVCDSDIIEVDIATMTVTDIMPRYSAKVLEECR